MVNTGIHAPTAHTVLSMGMGRYFADTLEKLEEFTVYYVYSILRKPENH